MAYGTRWRHDAPDQCIAEAHRRAGESEAYGYLYRFENHSYAVSSGWEDTWSSTGPILELTAYPIKHPTRCGFRLTNGRFVSRETVKRFALPTIDEALESYRARKSRQIAIYEARAENARRAHDLAVRPSWPLPPVVALTGGAAGD